MLLWYETCAFDATQEEEKKEAEDLKALMEETDVKPGIYPWLCLREHHAEIL